MWKEMTVRVKDTNGRSAYVYGVRQNVLSYINGLFGDGSLPYMYDDYSRLIVTPDQFDQLEEQFGNLTVEILDCSPYPTC